MNIIVETIYDIIVLILGIYACIFVSCARNDWRDSDETLLNKTYSKGHQKVFWFEGRYGILPPDPVDLVMTFSNPQNKPIFLIIELLKKKHDANYDVGNFFISWVRRHVLNKKDIEANTNVVRIRLIPPNSYQPLLLGLSEGTIIESLTTEPPSGIPDVICNPSPITRWFGC
ncbi:MAG: hypothetical protein V1848_03670 [Candidatus Magasanikbacteria bacterium]